MLRIFTPVKIQRLRPGLNPQTWVPEDSILTTRPPKPSYLKVNTETYGVPYNTQRLILKQLKTNLHFSYAQIFVPSIKGNKVVPIIRGADCVWEICGIYCKNRQTIYINILYAFFWVITRRLDFICR